jgi:hypothetical protein
MLNLNQTREGKTMDKQKSEAESKIMLETCLIVLIAAASLYAVWRLSGCV